MKASLCSSGHSTACLSRFFTSGSPPTSSQLKGQVRRGRVRGQGSGASGQGSWLSASVEHDTVLSLVCQHC